MNEHENPTCPTHKNHADNGKSQMTLHFVAEAKINNQLRRIVCRHDDEATEALADILHKLTTISLH
jgi:hypothetical protein